MKEKLQNKLAENFPFMIGRNVFTGKIIYDKNGKTSGVYCECHDGWFQLIYDCCKEIKESYEKNGYDITIDTIMPFQIKEKYGTLNMYFNCSEEAHNIVSKYEDMSETVCEFCGDTGILRNMNGWYKTLCENCFIEKNKIY